MMQMNIRFELQPKQRPKLAEAIAAALRTIPCYQKAPSLSYKIGDCTLEKDGTLGIPDTVDTEAVNALLTHLQEKGFTGRMEETEDRLIVTVPKDSFMDTALANLQNIIDNKGELLAKAFLAEGVALDIMEDTMPDWMRGRLNASERHCHRFSPRR